MALAVAGDGSVWWAEDEIDKMARVDPATGKIEEFKIPDVGGHAFPRRMNTDANGDLWVALWNAGKLMKIDYKTKEMTIYTPPTQTGGNYSVIVDKKNNYIWVSEHQVDKIARFDPKTQEWVEFPLPEAESRSAPPRYRSDQPEPHLLQRQHPGPHGLRGGSAVDAAFGEPGARSAPGKANPCLTINRPRPAPRAVFSWPAMLTFTAVLPGLAENLPWGGNYGHWAVKLCHMTAG